MLIKFQISGDEAIVRRVDKLITNTKRLKPFFDEAGRQMNKNIDDNFKNQGSRKGKWKSLSTSTQIARAKRTGYYKRNPSNPRILRWTGALQENRTTRTTNDYAQIIFNTPYAKNHQYGIGTPKREFLVLDSQVESLLIRALINHLTQ